MLPIDRAIQAAGSLTELAEKLEVSPQVIANWRKRRVPTDRCPAIEKATGGKVTKEQLRPDIFKREAA